MRPECIQAVTQAIGRPLNLKEIEGIENRIKMTMRQLAQKDPAWRSMTAADRLTKAAADAARQLVQEQALKKRRVALTILAHDRVKNYLERFPDNPLEGLDRMMAFSSDGKSGIQSIEAAGRAIRDEAVSRMLDVIDLTKGKFMGLVQDAAGNLALVRELLGADSGLPEAKAAAKQFREVAESLRIRFNRAGGDVGYLEDWGLPRDHSQARVAKSKDQWVGDHIRWADRGKYLKEDGTPMTDAELSEFMQHAWLTLATGGTSKMDPGKAMGSGMRANRGNESRQIHYKDADSFIAAQEKYGEKNLLELLLGHLHKASSDIALVEALGPNPDHQLRFWLDTQQKAADIADPIKAEKHGEQRNHIQRLYEDIAGLGQPPANAAIANGFDTYRALNVASRLGSAVLTSVTDQGTLALTARMNNMPVMQVFANEVRMLNPADATDRRLAMRAGLGLNQLIGSLNRWGADGLGSTQAVSGRIAKFSQTAASKVLQASGLNALTAGTQRAFGVTMLDTLGEMTRKHDSLAALDEADRARLEGQGVTDTDWQVWRLAQPEDWRGAGDTVLTTASIYKLADEQLHGIAAETGIPPRRLRDQAATKLLGTVLDETNMAIIEPGAREKVFMQHGFQRGTWKGEIARSFWQFKSFSVAMIARHFQRAMTQQTGWGKAGYLAALTASTTVFGALAIQLGEIAAGRDPKDITDDKLLGVPGLRYGLASFLKGGALGLYGDFLFSNQTQGGSSPLAAVGGPIAGDIESIFQMKGNAADGKEDQFGGNLVRFIKGHIPGANLWYTKAATDHLIFHQLQEFFSPGYLNRMTRRAQKDFGQSYWWEPGEAAPSRSPNLGAAVGEN